MAKNSITDYSKTASLNTDIQSVDIDEGCLPSGINNAIRELMTDLAEMNDGTVTLTSPAAGSINITGNITVGGTVDGRDVATDGSKLDGVEASADVTDTANVTAAGAAMLTGATFTGSITAPDATFNGTTAVKLPAGTDAQRPTGVNGMLRYNSDDAQFEGYADGAWGAIAGGGETSFLLYSYTATSGQTTFSGSDDNSATLSYTASNIIVTLNGITLENGTDYTASNGTSIVLTVGASAGDELNVIAFKSFTTADMVSATTGGTFNGNVAVNADLTVDTNTLHVDSTNNRVGIGTSSPSAVLHTKASGQLLRLETTEATGSGYLSIYDSSALKGHVGYLGGADDDFSIYNGENSNTKFFTNGAERMRIDDTGRLAVNTTSPNARFHVYEAGNSTNTEQVSAHSGFTAQVIRHKAFRAASTSYYFLLASSGNTADNEAWIRGDGRIAADNGYQTGADYAEFFEWDDGNSSNEDRRGYSVVLTNGNKIRKATSSDAASDIIGVISGHPSVVGDAAWASWSGKFNRDDFGGYIWETYTVTEWTEADGTEHSYHTDQIPSDVTAPADATIITEDDDGNTLKRKQVNSSYDDTQTYTPREERQEWDAVGMVGKLRLRAGQPTGDRWIKMRDIATDDDGNVTIEEWLVR